MKNPMLKILLAALLLGLSLVSCAPQEATAPADFQNFEEVLEAGQGKTVKIFMWGGNDKVNAYFDSFIAPKLKENYDITLQRVPMNAPDFVAKVLNEKKNNTSTGTIDLLWINAENFQTLKTASALYGPFTQLLDNQNKQYKQDLPELHFDSGIPIEGYEAIFGSAQLVYTYDAKLTPAPPKSYAEILDYAKANAGRLTYPNPMEDFVGSAFVRNAYYALTEQDFTEDLTYEEFLALSQPVIDYFKELHPFLWKEGKAFPATIALQDTMFRNGEVDLTAGFEVYQTAGRVMTGEYPDTVRTYVLDTGTVSNAHYLAIPYNAPEKAAALLVIDYLQGAEAQIEKMKPEVWGDLTAMDVTSFTEEQKKQLAELEQHPAITPAETLLAHRNGDMNAQYIEWVETIWLDEIIG